MILYHDTYAASAVFSGYSAPAVPIMPFLSYVGPNTVFNSQPAYMEEVVRSIRLSCNYDVARNYSTI
jgi:hypothetical protein